MFDGHDRTISRVTAVVLIVALVWMVVAFVEAIRRPAPGEMAPRRQTAQAEMVCNPATGMCEVPR